MPTHTWQTGDLLAVWAKLSRTQNGGFEYHPLLCHMIDVAAVAEAMWKNVLSRWARSEIARALGLSQEHAGQWVELLAGLHDLGKASPAFQYQVKVAQREIEQRLKGLGLTARIPGKDRAKHGTMTAATLPEILQNMFTLPRPITNQLCTLIGGHQGVFPTSLKINGVTRNDLGGTAWDRFRSSIVEEFANVIGFRPESRLDQLDVATAMKVAGLVSVADWIGSNTEFFQYSNPSSIADYRQKAVNKSLEALERLGWMKWVPETGAKTFTDLFGFEFVPNSLQRTVERIADDLHEPGLVIIESPMGEGKTEAAMFLADHWNATLGQTGCYFALPTQATSNQMFTRVTEFLKGRFPDDVVQLQLLHGHASLSSEFEVLRRSGDCIFHADFEGVEDDGENMHVAASEWFTYRKRGLLAPFGVGTIDQALLAVLQTRHAFVRLFGLAHKTVIVDEVHAYDAYMTTLLERLLEWLAALGSPVVMLSATLPRQRQEALFSAYARGLEDSDTIAPVSAEYPRVTWYTPSDRGACTVDTSPLSTKTVALEWVADKLQDSPSGSFPLGERLKAALVDGGCAAVVCSTVRRAQETYLALKPYFPCVADDGLPELDLLHSQFLFKDRQQREDRCLRRFGKPDDTSVKRPARTVLVATQVIEQSLDLDFDLMATDMAPVDLLLQRTGRMHRHRRDRPELLRHPRLLVRRPNIVDNVPEFDAGTTVIYDSHVLLRSWLALRDRDTIRVPEDVEDLIRAVYDDAYVPEGLPDPLQKVWESTRLELNRAKESYQFEARQSAILPPGHAVDDVLEAFNKELEEDSPDTHLTLQALTRLGAPTVQAVILGSHDPLLRYLDSPLDISGAKGLLERSVTVSHGGLVPALVKEEIPPMWQKNPLLRYHRLVVQHH